MNIQNHQTCPAGAYLRTAKATKRKARPVKKERAARSMLGGSRRFPHAVRDSTDSAAASLPASWPSTAPGTRLMSAPHARQYFASSRFWVAHFGQYISAPPQRQALKVERRAQGGFEISRPGADIPDSRPSIIPQPSFP